MTAFSLTRSEVWTLSTLLHLPIQPDSALGAWLALESAPQDAGPISTDLASLSGKGYYLPEKKDQPVLPELVRALTLAAVNAAEIALILQRGGHSTLTRFAQVGKGLVQFGGEGAAFCLHPLIDQEACIENLIPGWFQVFDHEILSVDLPPGAFLIFKQACALADLAAADTLLESEIFQKSALLDRSAPVVDWIKALDPAGSAVEAVEPGRLDEYLRLLIAGKFLRKVNAASLEIGKAGKSLAAVLSDPELCSLTVSLQTSGNPHPEDPDIGVFLYGAERLFLLHATPGGWRLHSLVDRKEALPWLQEMLLKGGLARYPEFAIPASQ